MTAMIEAFRKAEAQSQLGREKAVVDALKEELRPQYEKAKHFLANPWNAEASSHSAFIDSIGNPPTVEISQRVQNMRRTLSWTPRQLSDAMDQYNRLTYTTIADEHSREIFRRTVRQLLNSWDGSLESLRFQRASIERWYADAAASMGTAYPATESVTTGGLDVTAFVNREA